MNRLPVTALSGSMEAAKPPFFCVAVIVDDTGKTNIEATLVAHSDALLRREKWLVEVTNGSTHCILEEAHA